MTLAVRPVTIVHDGSDAVLLDMCREATALAGATLHGASTFDDPAPRHAEGLWLLLFDLQRLPAAERLHARLREAGARILPLGEEPGSLWIGPASAPGRAGCLSCLQVWAWNNRREPNHWAQDGDRAAFRRVGQLPLPPAVRAIVTATIARGIAEAGASDVRPDPASPLTTPALRRIDLHRLSTMEHGFIAYPDCPVCSMRPDDSSEAAVVHLQPRPKRNTEDARTWNPNLHLRTARRHFVDRQTGLVKHVYQEITSDLMPMYCAEMPIIGTTAFEGGYGRTATRERSELVSILEVIERFAGHRPRRVRSAERGSFRTMRERHGERCLDPRSFILHTEEQRRNPAFGFVAYDDTLEFNWCWGHSFRRQAPVLLPEQLAYYWLPSPNDRPENRFVYDTSSGCAMGGCLEEAVLYGLYEIIERDAYLTAWWGRIAPRRIDIASVPDGDARALITRAQAQGLRISLFDMRLDIDVPVIWGMVEDPSDDAPVRSYCASAASGRWQDAVFATLVEITTSMGVYRRTLPAQREKAEAMYRDGSLVRQMSDHVLLYSLPQTIERFDFLSKGEHTDFAECEAQRPSLREPDLTAELSAVLAKVLAVAEDVIVVNQTFEPMSLLGLHAAKVIAPGLTPVTFGDQYRRIDYRRLERAARARGRPDARYGPDTVNPHPHNFP